MIGQISARWKSATSFEPASVMEFGLKPTSLTQSIGRTRAVQPVTPHDVAPTAAAKSQVPLRYLVADRSEAGRRPVADLLARASSLL